MVIIQLMLLSTVFSAVAMNIIDTQPNIVQSATNGSSSAPSFVLPMHDTVSGKKYTLPKLSYGYKDLEPYIDAETMHYHHDKHHQKYVDELNKALVDHPKLQGLPLEQLLKNPDSLPESIRTKVINNGGGHYNHSLFWRVLGKSRFRQPTGALANALVKNFGSFEKFKTKFDEAATSVFGSGWTWLVLDTKGGLSIMTTKDQITPLKDNLKPVLVLDEWEHAYYLKYKNERPKYIISWWNIINWDYVSQLYDHILSNKK